MRNISMLVGLLLAMPATTVACGGGSEKEAKSADDAEAEADPMTELKNLSVEFDTEMKALTQPLDDLDKVIAGITSMPERLGIDAKAMMSMASTTVEGGKAEVNVEVSAEAKAEIEAALAKLQGIVASLKSIPERAAALTKKAGLALAKVPVLAGQVTAKATLVQANPFGSAEAKAKAKADVEGVKKVQADLNAQIADVQKKVTAVPGKATEAIAKLGASFAGTG